jgi:hypothetical protein
VDGEDPPGRPHLLPNRLTTVKYLVTRRPPAHLPSTRLPFERHVFTVVARVTFVREEADSDYHFILQERGYHMIGETPAPTATGAPCCTAAARREDRGGLSGDGREKPPGRAILGSVAHIDCRDVELEGATGSAVRSSLRISSHPVPPSESAEYSSEGPPAANGAKVCKYRAHYTLLNRCEGGEG